MTESFPTDPNVASAADPHTLQHQPSTSASSALSAVRHAIADTVTAKAGELKERATDSAHALKEKATQKVDEARVQVGDLHSSLEDYVRMNPLSSVLGALGVGFVIGLISRRR